MYNQKFGSADVGAVSGGTAATGQAVILAAAAPSTTEDWAAAAQGAVSDFYAAGLMNATLSQYYGPDLVYEFQYKPGGINSGECLGIASGPGQGTKVTLQPCGKTANTTWIYDAAAASGGYVPYISGSDTKYPAPYVLTAPGAGGDFTTQALRVDSKGVVAKDQMWQLISGVLVTSQMQAAANWALSQVGSTWSSHYGHYWSGYCEQFAEQAEGFQFSFGSAYLDYQAEKNAGRIHTDTNPPVGALVFYGGAGGDGHVAVSIGNGQEVGTVGYVGDRFPIRQYPVIGFLSNPYLGWAVPFGS